MIYVASSWRNPYHIAVVAALNSVARSTGDDKFKPYDFKNPGPGETGFHWSQTGMPSYDRDTNSEVPFLEYIAGINHPLAEHGFKNDFDAMKECDTCVLVLPCGRSAHLELGWFVGQGRKTAILFKPDAPVIPELMYKMVDYLAPSLFELLGWLGVPD